MFIVTYLLKLNYLGVGVSKEKRWFIIFTMVKPRWRNRLLRLQKLPVMKRLRNTVHRLLAARHARPRVDERNGGGPVDESVRKGDADDKPAAAESRRLNQQHRYLLDRRIIVIDVGSESSESVGGCEVAVVVELGSGGSFDECGSGGAAVKLEAAASDQAEAAGERVVRDEDLAEGVF